MKTSFRFSLCASLAFFALVSPLRSAIIEFDLLGKAGPGLLPGNEAPTTPVGSGGEIGAGIFFNDVTLQLTINVGWGSGNGFTDLTGPAHRWPYPSTDAESTSGFFQRSH